MELVLYERDIPNELKDLVKDNVFKEEIEIRKTDYHKFPIQFKDLNEGLIKRSGNVCLRIKEGSGIYGVHNIEKYLTKGFLFRENVKCPYGKRCLYEKCAKFLILDEGGIQVGECSDYWTPLLIIELKNEIQNKGV